MGPWQVGRWPGVSLGGCAFSRGLGFSWGVGVQLGGGVELEDPGRVSLVACGNWG
jgi:hypothetical protein